MKKNNIRYFIFSILLLLLLEALWIFAMYRTLTEPSNKNYSIDAGRLKSSVYYDLAWEDAALTVSGPDPYLILDCPQGIIERITLHWQALTGIGQIVCYYDSGDGYSEGRTVTASAMAADRVSFELCRFVRSVRIDFEDIDETAMFCPDTILVEYADKNAAAFLAGQLLLMLLFDALLIAGAAKGRCLWPAGVLQSFAFALLLCFTFRAYMTASGAVLIVFLLMEFFVAACIIFMNLGGTDCAKE